MLSKTSQYSLKAVLFLAKNSDSTKKYGVEEISNEIDVPRHYLAKLLQTLSKRSIIRSSKGPGGGFFMEANDLEQTLYDVVTAVDNPDYLNSCGLGLKECSDKTPCPVHDDFKKIREKIRTKVFTKTVGEMAELLINGKHFITVAERMG